MKKLLPLIMLILGLGAGVGAGMVLKPKPAEQAAACTAPETGHGADKATAGAENEAPAAACPEDPFTPEPEDAEAESAGAAYVALDKPFVVPVFSGDKTVAMVVISLSVATKSDGAQVLEAIQPRLRDSFLKVMFRHANSGGFDGSFTNGQKMDDLKAALLSSAKEVMGKDAVSEVLITEIARQDV